jgi:uncharacterized protein YciU (UPF0263 family)
MTDKAVSELILPEPISIKKRGFRVIEYGEMQSDEDVQQLIHLLWRQPEITAYYYYRKDGPMDKGLSAAHARGDILMNEMKQRFYAHPNFKRDYIQIIDRDGNYEWDWEKEVVEKGPEFRQVKLELTGWKKTQLEIWDKIQIEEEYREQRHKLRYAYDVFLSYAGADQAEADLIHGLIRKAERKVFMAPKIVNPGEDFAEEIRSALEGSTELWLLVSPSSAKSEWVISEWGAAWVLRKRIVPILHRCGPEALPDRLRKLQCIDLHQCEELVRRTFSLSEIE